MPARPRLAVGPVTPGWGSWEWVGQDLLEELSPEFDTVTFGWQEIPRAELVYVVKHPLPPEVWQALKANVVYAPVDYYECASHIDGDAAWLRRCQRIVVHCQRLRRYFEPYAPVEYLDHHVKYILPEPVTPISEGPILWVGVHSNLPPLADWLRTHRLPRPLVVLSNVGDATASEAWGFAVKDKATLLDWSPARHLEWLARGAAAIDVKADDFRARHKPPAKAIDWIAAGLPLAMSAGSSAAEHLGELGFELAEPHDAARWFSPEYAAETRACGGALRKMLSRQQVGRRLRGILVSCL